jgi:hypothetical protein
MADETVSGDIRYSRYWLPPLEAGEYKVVVQQTVTELHASAVPAAPFTPVNYDFVVSGPRFALNPADIYSVYPPEGATGAFDRSLPHIVFVRPTIPWERKASAASPDHQPWMALLQFSADDDASGAGIPRIEPRKVRDLIKDLPDRGSLQAVEILRKSQVLRPAADIGKRSLRRLLHHAFDPQRIYSKKPHRGQGQHSRTN